MPVLVLELKTGLDSGIVVPGQQGHRSPDSACKASHSSGKRLVETEGSAGNRIAAGRTEDLLEYRDAA